MESLTNSSILSIQKEMLYSLVEQYMSLSLESIIQHCHGQLVRHTLSQSMWDKKKMKRGKVYQLQGLLYRNGTPTSYKSTFLGQQI